MGNVWDEFDEAFDTKALQADAKEAADNGAGTYKETPDGEYEVGIEKLELTKSKKGKPMLSVWFNIIKGDNKGQKIFYSQVMDQGFGIHMASEFLRSLDTDVEISFTTYGAFAKTCEAAKLVTDDLEFALKYGHNTKGYGTYEIIDIFEKE